MLDPSDGLGFRSAIVWYFELIRAALILAEDAGQAVIIAQPKCGAEA